MNLLKNEIYAVKNDCISYSIYHESGGKEVQLDKDEKYVMRIKKNLSDPEALEFISNKINFKSFYNIINVEIITISQATNKH